ncbi:MAG: adenylate/guanylate cyclase domain-containing protein [Chloroflexota bacterium]|nr:adenylate/guanylate cyclase domain-containing protein [Chloroflexota bacterium]
MGSPRKQRLPTGTLTFLFSDIEGSTRLLTDLGDRYRDALERHAQILRTAITTNGGTEVSTEGDAFFAVFTSAIGAVRAAVEAQRALAAEPWPDGATVQVRIGMHTGEAAFGGDDYVGIDVNRAARIGAAGHGGQVLLSGVTAGLVGDVLPPDIELRDLGPHRLKDLEQPIRILQLGIPGLRDAFPPIRSLDTARGNLPAPMSSFVGRKRELATALEMMEERRLLTLTGPGGAGKTRLGQEVARLMRDRLRDGAWFVDLAPIRDAALVPLAICRAMNIWVDPGGDAMAVALGHLRHREAVLMLDNFEQVLAARDTVSELLKAADALRLLVTSREALGVYGEQQFEVPPFDVSDAVALFVDRARAGRPDFALTDANAPTIGRIVEHVAWLPLALELAATQLRVLTASDLLARLEQHLPLPSATESGRPGRQQTMRDAIAWSYDLLDESERRIFARLSALPGGFGLSAAEAVADAGDLELTILDGVAALVRKSLVRHVETEDDDLRFGMLEPILEFAAERLTVGFDPDATDARLARYCLAFAEEAADHLTAHDQAMWLDRCQREAPNLRRALDWAIDAGELEVGLRTATALWHFWQQRGPMWEGRDVLERLLSGDGGSPNARGRAHGAAGGLAWWSGDFEGTGRHYEKALALLEGSSDRSAEAEALYNAGFAYLWRAAMAGGADADRADEQFTRSLRLAEADEDPRGIGRALRGLGLVRGIVRGDPAGAIPTFQRSLALAEEAGDRWEMVESAIALGNGHRFSGDPAGGKRAYLRGIDLMAGAGNRQAVNGLLPLLAAIESELGRHDRAVRLWGAAQAGREAWGELSPPARARLVGDPMGAARAAIGEEAVERGLTEGRRMDHEAVLAYAHV